MISFLGWLFVVCASMAAGYFITGYVTERKHAVLFRDPGPLDDKKLLMMLRNHSYAPASPTHDRVQDAVERILRERDAARDEAHNA